MDQGKVVIDTWVILTIFGMAAATYVTRVGGYLLLGSRQLSPRTLTLLDAAPGCVLIAVIAPAFVSGRAADLIALGVTAAAASRLSLLPTVVVGIVTAGLLRGLL